MSSPHALIIDDEPAIRELLTITLGRMGIDCTCASDLAGAREALELHRYDLCLTDMRLPDGSGLDFLNYLQQHQPSLPVAVITAHGSMETAISALKAGAFDFVNKPVDLKMLRQLVGQALKLGQRGSTSSQERTLVGNSPAMQRLRETIAKLARSQAPIYISGESGTGKELVARLIHEQGPRAGQPFVPVNCGAIPQELIESELFGHMKGSFTGAVADKVGLFEAADGGSLFLDEIAELPLAMQVKLLRAIQEKRIRRVGAAQETAVDCRILSATHKDLGELVAGSRFRQDLYYRINVIEVRVPPLRERAEDIDDLVAHFRQRLAQSYDAAVPVLSAGARAALRGYRFPGNVRELENILERASTLCEGGQIEIDDLRLPAQAVVLGEEPADLEPFLEGMERKRILEALEETRWNRTKAAKLLGISLRALRYRLERLGMN